MIAQSHAHVHAAGEAFAHHQTYAQAIAAASAKRHKGKVQLRLCKAFAIVDDVQAACKCFLADFSRPCLDAVQHAIHQNLFEFQGFGVDVYVGLTL